MAKEILDVLIDGGKATPAPPLGPSLAMTGLDIEKVVEKINEKTRDFSGMKVPVKITYDTIAKDFSIKVGTPPTSNLLKKEINLEKAKYPEPEEGKPVDKTPIANITMDQIIKVAKVKEDVLLGKGLKNTVKEVLGAVVSMQGVIVEEKSPKEILREIEEGQWDNKF